ncbi:hypothetical protein JST97_02370 [bacterium]|nr:hypothetical protein [bacterium]
MRSCSVFAYRQNDPRFLEYVRRLRSAYSFLLTAACQQNRGILDRYRDGGYQADRQSFLADTQALGDTLLEIVREFDGQQIPNVLYGAHRKFEACLRLNYESLQALREADQAEGADRSRLLKEAEKKLKDALVQGKAGLREANAVLARCGR